MPRLPARFGQPARAVGMGPSPLLPLWRGGGARRGRRPQGQAVLRPGRIGRASGQDAHSHRTLTLAPAQLVCYSRLSRAQVPGLRACPARRLGWPVLVSASWALPWINLQEPPVGAAWWEGPSGTTDGAVPTRPRRPGSADPAVQTTHCPGRGTAEGGSAEAGGAESAERRGSAAAWVVGASPG